MNDPRRSGLGRAELSSLEERLGLLLVVRIVIVAVVVVGALVVPATLGVTLAEVGPLSAGYLAAAGAAEWYRRRAHAGRLRVHRLMLPLDPVYLALLTVPAGGPRSQLVFLFSLHLIAVTLLASPRAGVRIALWDSFLFIVVPTLSLAGKIGLLLGVHQVAAPPPAETAAAIMGFWAVALGTAWFSSVSERELRRAKCELTALAAMAIELEAEHDPEELLRALLRTTVATFGFVRGAVVWPAGERIEALVCTGLQPSWRCVLRRAPPAHPAAPALEVQRVPAWPAGFDDARISEALGGPEPVLACRFDPRSDLVLSRVLPGARNVVVLPLQADAGRTGVLALEHGGHLTAQRLPRRTVVMLGQFTRHATLALRSAHLLAERQALAMRDGLTGLANRRDFDQKLAGEVNRASRHGGPLSLVVIDLDHFKAVNDTRGHLAGDEVLRHVGQVLAGVTRDMDTAARYGGEEFALILPSCAPVDACRVMDRIRASLATTPALLGVTVSAGVATLPSNANDSGSLLAAADEALYRSKRDGRNRVTVSDRAVGPRLSSTGTGG